MANTIGTSGNDILTGSGNDTLTGGGGNDKFVYDSNYGANISITDFDGIGKGVNPSAAVIAEVDTLSFQVAGFTAQNLLLTQNGNNLEINFEGAINAYYASGFTGPLVVLQNFALENLDNLSKSTGATVDLGNILFYGQTTITDSFDVFNANSTQSTIFNKNTVTFLNDLNNNVNGFDNSDDVINGQGGDDIIDGLSGNDILRGGAGNDTLLGGAGNDILESGEGNNSLVGGTGNDILNVNSSTGNVEELTGNNTLNGGAGDDNLIAGGSKGNNLLSGGDGNDLLYASDINDHTGYMFFNSSGDDTLNGGAGDDILNAKGSEGNNLLSGGDGDDTLTISGSYEYRLYSFSSSGNNTLNGGAGDDKLYADFSSGNNLLSGGDGNDTLSTSSYDGLYDSYLLSSGNNTLNGGAGNDILYADISTGNNLFSGGDGNDTFYLTTTPLDTTPSDLVTQTVDGGKGDDLLSVDYINATGQIATTFNATTNTGSITAGTYKVNYKNIEGLNISGTAYNDNIVGSNGNDTLSTGDGGKDTIDGGRGDDVLSADYSNATGGISTAFNSTTNIGSITAGTYQVNYQNIERLNISGTRYDDNIVGNNGNDTLSTGNGGKDTIDGGRGDDVLSVDYSNVTKGIATTFNSTTNIGSITAGTYQVNYKNIERLNISGTRYDDNIVGNNGNDTLSTGDGGKDTIDGGKGDDVLSVDYSNATGGITSTFNATTNIGSITAGTNSVSYKNIEGLNISGTRYDDKIVGNSGNDTLSGGDGNDTLIGGNGNDTFVFNSAYEGIDRIDDFNPTNEIIEISTGFGGGLSIGSLSATQFTIGASATTNSQQFIYDNITGGLYFDLYGSASVSSQVQFAQLSAGLSLTNNNFVVV
ncbi:MAG: calcium-binding protein [Nostoc sp.]